MDKTTVICIKFLNDVACKKFLKSASVLRSYSKNKCHVFETRCKFCVRRLFRARFILGGRRVGSADE